jgi:hypothetical protein
LLVLVTMVGCGGDGLNLAPVEGTVLLNDQPVADAGVMFYPVESDQGPPASGSTNKEGRFKLMTNNREGAPVGNHRVSIAKADPFGEEIPPEQLEMADVARRRGLKAFKTKHFIPERYADVDTSGLTATVEDDDNVVDFKLVSP